VLARVFGSGTPRDLTGSASSELLRDDTFERRATLGFVAGDAVFADGVPGETNDATAVWPTPISSTVRAMITSDPPVALLDAAAERRSA